MSNYSLTAPNPNAYEPSNVEAALASQLGGPNANYLGGHIFNAQMQRQAGQRDYSLALQNANQQQRELAHAHMANELETERMKLEGQAFAHPGAWSLSGTLAPRVAPGMAQTAKAFTEADLTHQQARGRSENALAVNRMSEAGVTSPVGAQYSLNNVPNLPSTQGIRPDVQREGMQQGGENFRHATLSPNGHADPRIALAARDDARIVAHEARIVSEQRNVDMALQRYRDNMMNMVRTPEEKAAGEEEIRRTGAQRIAALRANAPQRTAASTTAPTVAAPAPAVTASPVSAQAQPATTVETPQVRVRRLTVVGDAIAARMNGTFVGIDPSNGKLGIQLSNGTIIKVDPE